MKKDAANFVKTCHTCQVQANLIYTHPTSLQNMTKPWPFHTWGLDLIGPINPASSGYIWILVATEYFTKWVEAITLRRATGAAVANFIQEHIITHFGIPYKLISDNGTPFIQRCEGSARTLSSQVSTLHTLLPSKQWASQSHKQNAITDLKQNGV
jgi:hypothetical protein